MVRGGLVLVIGRARSGKSRFAEGLAAASGKKVVYVATAVARDQEMRERMERHRKSRPPDWETVEEPLHLARVIASRDAPDRIFLIDCLGVYVSNLLEVYTCGAETPSSRPWPLPGEGEAAEVKKEIEELVQAAAGSKAKVIVVSNEVGWGTEPAYPLGRVYGEWLGWANQRLAACAEAVYLVVCSLPPELKSWGQAEKRLRWGFTTGTCASAAAKAAVRALFAREQGPEVAVSLPEGRVVSLPVRVRCGEGRAEAVVVKDAGDDPDVTHGVEIVAVAEPHHQERIVLEAGPGIGRVTSPGLAVPVGEPAINPVPKKMILQAIQEVLPPDAGVRVTVSIPKGGELARRTLNPRLGIVGGLSLLGTTGLVRPMSEEAFRASLALQIDMALAKGLRTLVLSPGAKSRRAATEKYGLREEAIAETGNFLGYMLEACAEKGVERVLLWGHAGKLVKLAAGSFNAHSRAADGRRETIAAWAAAEGAAQATVRELLAVPTMEQAHEVLKAAGLAGVWSLLAARASEQARSLVRGRLEVGTVLLDRWGEILGQDEQSQFLMQEVRR